MQDLRVTLLQAPLVWENKEANLNYFAQKIAELKEETDVLLLPEMFSTGFSMNSTQLAEGMDGATVQWMREQAAKKNCVLCGSFIAVENNRFYNRLVWMKQDGSFDFYNKRHLFRMAKENEHYSEGSEKLIVRYKSWSICLLVCYDLRFPVWSRRSKKENYDLLIYIANWPEKRSHAWNSLLIARAIENQCYVAACNRVGEDGNAINYSGDSVALNYLGEKLSSLQTKLSGTETVLFEKNKLLEFRKVFPADLDADEFMIST
jgi:omega-amidase